MGVDHAGGHVAVAQEFLHAATVAPAFAQMGGERMAQRMGCLGCVILCAIVQKTKHGHHS
jgi:hypothetical protein